MIHIQSDQWQLLSFPDATVKTMKIQSCNIEINVDSGFLDSPFDLVLNQGTIKFANCRKIKIRSYNPTSKQWYDTLEILKDLCEVEFGENVKLKGFGKRTGHWTEFILTKPSAKYAVFTNSQ